MPELTIEDVAIAAHDISGIEQSKAISEDMIERFVRTFEPERIKN